MPVELPKTLKHTRARPAAKFRRLTWQSRYRLGGRRDGSDWSVKKSGHHMLGGKRTHNKQTNESKKSITNVDYGQVQGVRPEICRPN